MAVYQPPKTPIKLDETLLEALKKYVQQGKLEIALKELQKLEDLKPPTVNYSTFPTPTGLPGWVCPVCVRGNAPTSSTCPCTPLKFEVTY